MCSTKIGSEHRLLYSLHWISGSRIRTSLPWVGMLTFSNLPSWSNYQTWAFQSILSWSHRSFLLVALWRKCKYCMCCKLQTLSTAKPSLGHIGGDTEALWPLSLSSNSQSRLSTLDTTSVKLSLSKVNSRKLSSILKLSKLMLSSLLNGMVNGQRGLSLE